MPELHPKSKPAEPGAAPRKSIEDWLGDPLFQASVTSILPRHLTGERFAAVALRQFKLVPKLRECTPASVLASMIDAAQLGLEIGLGGECWLIPYKIQGTMTATMQIGYLGHLKLAWQSQMISSVEANVVTREEVETGRFEFQHGTAGFLHHRPIDGRVLNEKTIAYAYALVWAKGAERPIWRVLDANEIARVRKQSGSPNSPGWTSWFDEMAMAKALKRTLKWAPKSRELAAAVALDDESDAGAPQSYQSRSDVAGLLSATGVRSEEERDMNDDLDRSRRGAAAGAAVADPDREAGAGNPGTGPLPPISDDREPVPVEARRPAPPAGPKGNLGW